MAMEISRSTSGDIEIISLVGTMEERNMQELDELLEPIGGRKIILNLNRLDYVNSQGISLLLVAWRRARRDGGRLMLAEPRGSVRKLFDLTRLNSFISTCESVEEAVAQLTPQNAAPAHKGKE